MCVTDCSFRRCNQQQAEAQTEVRNLLTHFAALLILVCLFIIYNLTHTLHANVLWDFFFNLPVLVSNSNAERPGCWRVAGMVGKCFTWRRVGCRPPFTGHVWGGLLVPHQRDLGGEMGLSWAGGAISR